MFRQFYALLIFCCFMIHSIPLFHVDAREYSYPTPVLFDDLKEMYHIYRAVTNKSFNYGVLGFGVENLMSYAAYFCLAELKDNNTTEVVSVSKGNGDTIDDDIILSYSGLFARKLDITRVNSNAEFPVDFKTVDDLINKRPHVVGNCVLLLIWPNESENDTYDIEAVRKLYPRTMLTVYDVKYAASGSPEFKKFLDGITTKVNDSNTENYRENGDSKLDDYVVDEDICQEVHFKAGEILEIKGKNHTLPPGVRALSLRLVKVRRKDVPKIPYIEYKNTYSG